MKRYIKYILCLFIFSFFLCDTVLADECDAEDMARAKALAENVNIHYEYIGKKEDSNGISFEQYHIVISDIVDGIEVGIAEENSEYDVLYDINSSEVKDGTLEFDWDVGELTVHVYHLSCSGKSLVTENIKLYRKNPYASREECKKLEKYNLDVCDEDYQGDIDDSKFYDTVVPYFDDGKVGTGNIASFIKKNFLIFIGIGILFFGLIIFLIYRHRKRSVLE